MDKASSCWARLLWVQKISYQNAGEEFSEGEAIVQWSGVLTCTAALWSVERLDAPVYVNIPERSNLVSLLLLDAL